MPLISAGAVLERLLAKMGWDEKTSTIYHFWDEELGNLVSWAPLVGVKSGKLYVQSGSSVVRQEIIFRSKDILKNLNQRIGEKRLREIKFV
ncbi:MAG: DUF721 domain-containing protein [Elusimicrobiota bacterium]